MSKPDEDDNRRRETRRGWWFPVEVAGGDAELTAVCRDVSGSGMQLALSGPIADGTRVSLRFEPPGGAGPRTAAGRIVRCEPNDDDSRVLWPHKAGVVLDAVDEELAALDDPG